jgi:hypothetical protein
LKIKFEQKHKDIIATPGHLLVTGGPGSGKTTIALLKAQERCRTLKPGQEVLFLSFSRAAVRQILTRCKGILRPEERKLVQVRTYHSFCLEVLGAHGRLLCARQIRFLYPGDERLRKSTFNGTREAERSRLSVQEGVFCFDLVAPAVATLFERCGAVRALYGSKYPLVIVDEFQDTDDDQWRIIQRFLEATDVFCLADPEQRIFEYRENVDPRRIETLREQVRPAEFDLGADNHRSPTAGILQFADAILHNRSPLPNPPEVMIVQYYNTNNFPSTVHAAVDLRPLRFVELHVPDLWRLQAQHGVFLDCPYANVEDEYPFDRIVFPLQNAECLIPEAEIYPDRKSRLEQLLNRYFETDRQRATLSWLKEIGQLRNTVFSFPDLEKTPDQLVPSGELPVHTSWNDAELHKWLTTPDESWHRVHTNERVDLVLPMQPQAAGRTASSNIRKLLAGDASRRSRAIGFTVMLDASAQSSFLSEILSWRLDTLWDGLRTLPYGEDELAGGYGSSCATHRRLRAERLSSRDLQPGEKQRIAASGR